MTRHHLDGAEATPENIVRACEELPADKDDSIFVFYCGHGGTITGSTANAKVYVYDTSRWYTLNQGDHQFWWMAKENRIGLDIEGR